MSKNLEDIFREGLENSQSAPSSGTWSKIKTRLWWSEIVKTISGITVEPSPAVWRNIYFRLWLKDFTVFNALRFNMYYLATLVVGTSVLAYNLPSETNLIAGLGSNVHGQIVRNEIPASGSNAQVFIADVSSPAMTTVKNVVEKTNPSESNNNAYQSSQNIAEPSVPIAEVTKPDLTDFYPSLPSGFLLNKLDDIQMTGDSNLTDWTGKPIYFERFRWSADVFVQATSNTVFGFHHHQLESSSTDNILPNFVAKTGYSAGVMLNREVNGWMFQGGVAFNSLQFKSDFKQLDYTTDTVLVTWVEEGGSYNFDTTWVLNLDSLINGNPTYVPVVDSVFVYSIDTFSVEKPVTNKVITEKTTLTKLAYAEFPLTAGYTLSRGKFECRVKAMIIPALLVYSTGFVTNPYSEFGELQTTREIHSQWLLSAGGGMELLYKPSARIGISVEPFFRRNLNSLYKEDFPYQLKTTSWGCKMGIRYYLR